MKIFPMAMTEVFFLYIRIIVYFLNWNCHIIYEVYRVNVIGQYYNLSYRIIIDYFINIGHVYDFNDYVN